jgi:membrane protein
MTRFSGWFGLRWAGRIAGRTWKEYTTDGCFPRAAALSFTTLLSLIPLAAVFFSLYSSFGGFEANIEDARKFLFDRMNPGSMDSLNQFYDSVMVSSDKAAAVGVVGLVTLILSAWAILNSLEQAFNHIWRGRSERSLARKFISYTAFIFWFPIMISLSIFLTGYLKNYFFGEQAAETSSLYRVWELGLPFVLTWGAFYFAYAAIPNRPIPWRAALVGSLAASLLWELAKVGFNYYVTRVSSFQKIYSALGTVPLFLLWVYYSWLIVLFGAELAFVLVHPEEAEEAKERVRQYSAYYALRVMVELAGRFRQGQGPATALQAMHGLDIDAAGLPPLLSRLAERGLVIRTGDSPVRFSLGKDPRILTLQEIVLAGEGDLLSVPSMALDPEDRKFGEALAEARLEKNTVLSRKTLEDLLPADTGTIRPEFARKAKG